jgi:hypothetical protein
VFSPESIEATQVLVDPQAPVWMWMSASTFPNSVTRSVEPASRSTSNTISGRAVVEPPEQPVPPKVMLLVNW